MSVARKGKPKSAEWRAKIAASNIGKNLGKSHPQTEATKDKIGRANSGRIRADVQGSNNPKWKDGRSFEPDYYKEINRVMRSRRRAAGAVSLDDWKALKELYGFRCPACGRPEPEIRLTLDHIVPVSLGGTSDSSNLQPLCRSCNSKKNATIKKYEPRQSTA